MSSLQSFLQQSIRLCQTKHKMFECSHVTTVLTDDNIKTLGGATGFQIKGVKCQSIFIKSSCMSALKHLVFGLAGTNTRPQIKMKMCNDDIKNLPYPS